MVWFLRKWDFKLVNCSPAKMGILEGESWMAPFYRVRPIFRAQLGQMPLTKWDSERVRKPSGTATDGVGDVVQADGAETLLAEEVDVDVLVVVVVVAQTEFVARHARSSLDDMDEVVGAKQGHRARDDRLVDRQEGGLPVPSSSWVRRPSRARWRSAHGWPWGGCRGLPSMYREIACPYPWFCFSTEFFYQEDATGGVGDAHPVVDPVADDP